MLRLPDRVLVVGMARSGTAAAEAHELRCRVAVLLNLEPDHLDRHGTFEAYRAAKLRIFERAEAAVVPRGLGLRGIEFSSDDPLPAEPRIPGAHNRENAAYADAPLHLILGGSLKGESFDALAAALGRNLRSAHLIGEAADELAA